MTHSRETTYTRDKKYGSVFVFYRVKTSHPFSPSNSLNTSTVKLHLQNYGTNENENVDMVRGIFVGKFEGKNFDGVLLQLSVEVR